MTNTKGKTGGRFLGWFMLLAAMALMLASIFSEAIRPTVAVPVGSMFLIFALILFNASNPGRDRESATSDDSSNE